MYGPESVKVISIRGEHPLRLRLIGPAGATFRIRNAGTVAPCTVTDEVRGLTPRADMPSNATSRYAIECRSAAPRRAVLLPEVQAGAFRYEFEVPIGRR
ncbi:hypothetical protein GCM10009798_09550 [Nocardioides panacihumi]|uniref:Uncharacterized protein n=1 Tax=Nocardioides panacihumi TaxID=400774 RepID=A0ABP5BV13_9ACTN